MYVAKKTHSLLDQKIKYPDKTESGIQKNEVKRTAVKIKFDKACTCLYIPRHISDEMSESLVFPEFESKNNGIRKQVFPIIETGCL